MSVGELEVFKVAIMYKDYKEYILRHNGVNKWLYKQLNNRREKTNHANRKPPYVGKPLLPLSSSARRWSLILSSVLSSLSSKEENKMAEKVTSQWRNLANTMLSKWWWFASPVIPCGHYISSVTMWRAFTYGILCQIPELQSNHEKNISQTQIEKNPTKCQTNIPQDCQNHEKHGRDEELS